MPIAQKTVLNSNGINYTYEADGPAGAITEYLIISINGNLRKIPLHAI